MIPSNAKLKGNLSPLMYLNEYFVYYFRSQLSKTKEIKLKESLINNIAISWDRNSDIVIMMNRKEKSMNRDKYLVPFSGINMTVLK